MRKISDERKLIIFIVVLVVAVVACVVIAACIKRQEPNRADGETMLIKCGAGKIDGQDYTIVYDPETGIQYVFTGSGVYPLFEAWGRFKERHE